MPTKPLSNKIERNDNLHPDIVVDPSRRYPWALETPRDLPGTPDGWPIPASPSEVRRLVVRSSNVYEAAFFSWCCGWQVSLRLPSSFVRHGAKILWKNPRFMVQMLALRGVLPLFWQMGSLSAYETIMFSMNLRENPRRAFYFSEVVLRKSPELQAAVLKLKDAPPEEWANPENATRFENPWGKR